MPCFLPFTRACELTSCYGRYFVIDHFWLENVSCGQTILLSEFLFSVTKPCSFTTTKTLYRDRLLKISSSNYFFNKNLLINFLLDIVGFNFQLKFPFHSTIYVILQDGVGGVFHIVQKYWNITRFDLRISH